MLPGYIGKKLKGYQSMREDLILCKNAANYLLNHEFDHVITTSLYHSLIILYGKCYTDASTSKSPKLEIKDCFTESENALLNIHKEIMHLRHNFVAHRGSTEHEISFPYLKLNIEDYSRQVRVKQVKRRMPSRADLKGYLDLFFHVISIIENKFEKEANKVWNHMLDKYSPEELAYFKIAGPTKKCKCK